MAGMVSGLASGLDSASIVSQLIAVERNSQTLVKSRLSTEQSNVKSLQDLNSKLVSLTTLSEKLSKNTAWNPVAVTVSSDQVTATGTASTTTGAISFTPRQLAVAHAVSFETTAAMSTAVVGGDPHAVRLTVNGKEMPPVDAGDGTLSGLVNGINAPGTGLKAGLVKVGQDETGQALYRLRVTSATTGAASRFSLTDSSGGALLGGASELAGGEDAVIEVGQDTITSPSNTLTGVLNGLDVTLKAGVELGKPVELTVSKDADAIAKSVKELVDTVNSLLSDMDKATAYATAGSSGSVKTGTLAGDAQVRSVRSALLSAVYPTDGTSLAGMGVQTDRYGKLVLDESKLKSALAADPAKVAAAFTAGTNAGFAERVRSVAKGASDSVSGTVTNAIKGRDASIRRLQSSVEAWDLRLELRTATLTKQFTAMETALASLSSQSSWLSAQLSSSSSDS